MLDSGLNNSAPGNRAQVRAAVNNAWTAPEIAPWKAELIAKTAGTKSGAIFAAALALNDTSKPVTFARSAIRTSDNMIMAGFRDRQGCYHYGAFVGSAGDLEQNAKLAVDHFQLTKAQVTEFYAALRAWITTDYAYGQKPFLS